MFGVQARAVQCTMLVRILESLAPSFPDCLTQVVGPPTGDSAHVWCLILSTARELFAARVLICFWGVKSAAHV